jgi:LysM repeat protein
MNRVFCLIIIWIIVINASIAGEFNPVDSLGLEKKDGKSFILHKVDAKETFYSISKRYSISIDDIVNNNLETREGLKIDQILWIPYNQPQNTTIQNTAQSGSPTGIKAQQGSIVHKVKPSETMFSISRQYNVKIDDIKSWNNILGNELKIGQDLIIRSENISPQNQQALETKSPSQNPVDSPSISSEKSITVDATDAMIVHTVESTQTLFSISRMYNVTVEDLKKWNELEQSELNVGQKLIVKRRTEQEVLAEVKPEKKPDITAHDKTVIKEKFEEYEASTQRTSKAENEKAEKMKPPQTPVANASGGSKIIELGFAEVIEGTDDTKKFRALHKTAPVGTIIQVKNEMNNLSVFVRVLGTLPSTGSNDKTLIKITKAAYERLGAIDPRFPVEISYVP